MHRTKSTSRHELMVRASSFRSDDDVSLDAEQEETPATTHDATSSSAVPQRRGGVPS